MLLKVLYSEPANDFQPQNYPILTKFKHLNQKIIMKEFMQNF